MLLSKEELIRLSDKISDILVSENVKVSDIKNIHHEKIISYSDRLAVLFDADKSIYDAFHEEHTLDYFKTLLKFDIAYKIRLSKG